MAEPAPIIAIVGPTASGKTRLSLAIARRFGGEIINADSRQVYRRMDIGTAKPTPAERAAAPHRLLDLLDPDQPFDLETFLAQAQTAIGDIRARGRLPIVAGGTGQYVWALLEGWAVPQAAPDWEFRRQKEQEAAEFGPLHLHAQLAAIDSQRAAALDPRNVRRVIRALEIFHSTGRRPSEFRQRHGAPPRFLVLGLTLPRQELYRRIDQRFDQMLRDGLLDEVKRLAEQGYELGQGALDCPGYRELGRHLAGVLSLDEAVQQAKFATHALARRQYAWFKLTDSRIRWLEALAPDLEEQAAELVSRFLSRGGDG